MVSRVGEWGEHHYRTNVCPHLQDKARVVGEGGGEGAGQGTRLTSHSNNALETSTQYNTNQASSNPVPSV